MNLQAYEFIRRFLLHVIPKGLMRVRHFGFLANNSKERFSKCHQLLGLLPAMPKTLCRLMADRPKLAATLVRAQI